MATVTNALVYKDFDFKFTAHPVTGKLLMKKNAESVKQALKLLILTNLGEKQYKPEFGSGVKGSLFEPYTKLTEGELRSAIQIAIGNYEPRVELIDIRFGGNPDRNELTVSIIFRPRNSTEKVTLHLNLERVR